MLSHWFKQQYMSPIVTHTHCSTVSVSHPGVPCEAQQLPVHEPHWSASPAQRASQAVLQQKGSSPHTQTVTALSLQHGDVVATQHDFVEFGFPLVHTPPTHTSPTVHANPSSHGLELFSYTHPDAGTHLSFVHRFLSSHWTEAPPQVPPVHLSPVVHLEPSSHTVPSAALDHANLFFAESQTWHAFAGFAAPLV